MKRRSFLKTLPIALVAGPALLAEARPEPIFRQPNSGRAVLCVPPRLEVIAYEVLHMRRAEHVSDRSWLLENDIELHVSPDFEEMQIVYEADG